MKTYAEAIDYLYSRLPMFTRDGASAYKKDLDRTIALCEALGNPQHKFKTIHVAGTNGKGSSSHMLAAILAQAGYKTGLYTSPHLVDFRERVRINGEQVSEDFVVDFVQANAAGIEAVQPSFFEATVALAFDYFAKEEVDIAVIEVGLGGRLDSTNIISPAVCLITNIGMDHMNLLGDTLAEIAAEKAGIIKPLTPVVISETQESIAAVFRDKADRVQAPLFFADQIYTAERVAVNSQWQQVNVQHQEVETVYDLDLLGSYQVKNLRGVLAVIEQLQVQGFKLTPTDIAAALSKVQLLTGLQGRWQTLCTDPLIICDTGHNEDGIKQVVQNLEGMSYVTLHIVIGAMRDKDLAHMLPYLPKNAVYYFSNPDMPRAMPAEELSDIAAGYQLKGKSYGPVLSALAAAKEQFKKGDLIFVGGSNFVVAEVLQDLAKK
ncbi:bifunctional folylpolyglutamate synthase/dihydrofolate synthase [Sphingobacterium sp. Mn56C]|uniref:bifunctional folylpolyglutamate synthase/dihydrofolate synthase n=1 Tax=Sphingobacterium sp. Mn56C TaxID=3395261 RepID=UPI003BC334AC